MRLVCKSTFHVGYKALQAAQRQCEELQEALSSRSQELEMLQQEVSSADQQKQVRIQFFCMPVLQLLLLLLFEILLGIVPFLHSPSLKRKLFKHNTPFLSDMSTFFIKHPHTRSLCFVFLAQILTAQFREMEQDLTEAVKLRDEERRQWAEQTARADAELAALRASLETLERDRTEEATQRSREAERINQEMRAEVAGLEAELGRVKEAELAAVRAHRDASERFKAEMAQLESELASVREAEGAAVRVQQDMSEREKSEVEKLEKELVSLREEREGALRKGEVFGEVWRRLCSLTGETLPEEVCDPADPDLLLQTVQSVQTHITKLKDECCERHEQLTQLTQTMETLQGMNLSTLSCCQTPFFYFLFL